MANLNDRQQTLDMQLTATVDDFGPFTQGFSADGCAYQHAIKNEQKNHGVACANCIFFNPPNSCRIVEGPIQPMGRCRFWIIPGEMIIRDPLIGTPDPQVDDRA